MRVAAYYGNSDLRIEERPIPKIGAGELLIRVHASGICGSDVMEWYRIDKVPLVLGHEIAGEITAIGEEIKDFKVGDRVSASHHVPCEECHYCLSGHETVCETLRKTNFDPGGFCEYIRLPAINVKKGVYPLPDNVSYEEATFIEPLACVLRGQRLAGLPVRQAGLPVRQAGMKKGRTVLVIGSGISGLLHIELARYSGAEKIIATDISDYRLKKARELGADKAIHAKGDIPALIRKFNDGRLADLVILCTGARPAITQAMASVGRGGCILFFAAADKDAAIPSAINDIFWRNEVTLMSSYAGTPAEHIKALDLISIGGIDVKKMITHRFPLKDIGRGFKLVAEADESIKVIIKPQK